MPTDTFFRLPEEKRQRIFQAAISEFASCHYNEASINRIIKEAQIPRGSFYQYFQDKEDLFFYVFEQISKEKVELYRNYPMPEDAGFADTILAVIPAILEWIDTKPLYYQVGMRLNEESGLWNQELFSHFSDGQELLISMLKKDQDQGLIRRDIDLTLVAQIYLSISQQVLKEYYEGTNGRENVYSFLNRFFDILQNGIAAPKKEGDHHG